MVMSMPPSTATNAPPPPPTLRRPPEIEVSDGIVVSFTVAGTIQVGRIFTLQIFLVNLSKHTRRFQVIVPNRKRNYSDVMNTQSQGGRLGNPLKDLPIEPYLEETGKSRAEKGGRGGSNTYTHAEREREREGLRRIQFNSFNSQTIRSSPSRIHTSVLGE
jgi:hypothetical protein